MGMKSRGSNAERQLIHMFWERGFAAVRVAGSGSSQYPSADIIVGKDNKKYVIECKTTKKDKKYLGRQEVNDLIEFTEKFGGTPFVAIRFFRKPWVFVKPKYLRGTKKSMILSKEIAKKYGIGIEDL